MRLLSSPRVTPAILVLCCVSLFIVNVALQRTNASLRKRVEAKDAASQASPGDFAPTMRGRSLSGETVSFPIQKGKDTVVFVFSKFCAFCDQNWANWQTLMSLEPKFSPILVDLSMGARSDYLSAHHISSLPFIHEIDPAMIAPYKLSHTPQTILIGDDQKIRGVWTGTLTSRDVAEISDRINNDLPVATSSNSKGTLR